MTASPSLLLVSLRWSLWPSSGQPGSASATSAWRACNGAKLHMQAAQLHVHTSATQNGNVCGQRFALIPNRAVEVNKG
eukprot:7547344-Alexandrium_andersonii.AAC.1